MVITKRNPGYYVLMMMMMILIHVSIEDLAPIEIKEK